MDRHEDEFAVGRLPHQEVRQPLLAAGADDQVGIGNVRRIEIAAERIGVDRSRIALALRHFARQPLGGAGDFLARSVIEGDHEIELGVGPGQFLGFVQERADIGLQPFPLPDHAHAHAVAMQRRQIVAYEAAEQSEEIADFGRRPRPVLGAERKDRQVKHAEFMGGANHAAQRLDAAAMAFSARQAPRCRPAPVSIHDDRHMQRDGSIRSFRGGGGGVRHYLNSRTSLDS